MYEPLIKNRPISTQLKKKKKKIYIIQFLLSYAIICARDNDMLNII